MIMPEVISTNDVNHVMSNGSAKRPHRNALERKIERHGLEPEQVALAMRALFHDRMIRAEELEAWRAGAYMPNEEQMEVLHDLYLDIGPSRGQEWQHMNAGYQAYVVNASHGVTLKNGRVPQECRLYFADGLNKLIEKFGESRRNRAFSNEQLARKLQRLACSGMSPEEIERLEQDPVGLVTAMTRGKIVPSDGVMALMEDTIAACTPHRWQNLVLCGNRRSLPHTVNGHAHTHPLTPEAKRQWIMELKDDIRKILQGKPPTISGAAIARKASNLSKVNIYESYVNSLTGHKNIDNPSRGGGLGYTTEYGLVLYLIHNGKGELVPAFREKVQAIRDLPGYAPKSLKSDERYRMDQCRKLLEELPPEYQYEKSNGKHV